MLTVINRNTYILTDGPCSPIMVTVLLVIMMSSVRPDSMNNFINFVGMVARYPVPSFNCILRTVRRGDLVLVPSGLY